MAWFCERWENENICLVIMDEDEAIPIDVFLGGGYLRYKNLWKLADEYSFGGFCWYWTDHGDDTDLIEALSQHGPQDR